MQDVDKTGKRIQGTGGAEGEKTELIRKVVDYVILCYIKMMAFLSCRASSFVPNHQLKCSEVMLVKTKLLGK